MTTLDQNQQDELTHLVRCSLTHPNWAEYCRLKAEWKAERDPSYWGWLPKALESSAKDESATSSTKPDEPPQTG